MQQIKQLSGFLNSDDSQEVIGSTQHKMAMNGLFRGVGNSHRFENRKGTTVIENTFLPVTGTNQCIGAFYDELKQRIIWANYNSGGLHGIYQLITSTGVVSRIILVGYNTVGDILNFTLDGFIYNMRILYGDAVQGDTLYFNNSQKEPCEVNIDMALAGTYGNIKRSYIEVIKAPPQIPAALTYEDDITVTVNNLRKKLFKFKYRYIYINNEKSVWSSQGVLPLPINYSDSLVDGDQTKNSRIAAVIQTGDNNVKKLEIAAAISSINTFGDFFSIATLDKSILSIPDNDTTVFRFFNDQAYIPVDVERSNELFDLVPLKANALEFLNGNVPIYGGLTEGYNISQVIGAVTSSFEPEQTTQPPFVFVADQSGNSGFGTGNIRITVIGKITIGDQFYFKTTGFTTSYTAAVATATDVLSGLSAAAVVNGFTVISTGSDDIVITKTGESLLEYLATPLLIAVTDSFVYDRNARYNFVLVYLDAAGRSIGSLTSAGMAIQTINYTETAGVPNIPKILLSISSRPPIYASYYQIGRTKNLSKLSKLEWVSFLTFKDSDYAYISIENLNGFILENPSSKFLAYDFSTNDRIRFIKILSGTVNTVYTDKDFGIQSQVIDPIVNGTIQQGQFLKINLPPTDSTFDFGTQDFYNYYIELYTPAESAANGLDVDYEFGERYSIGNALTANAFHQGMLQNQTADLATPATFQFTQGDYYYRNRKISAGNVAKWGISQQSNTTGKFYPSLKLNSSTIDASSYAVQSTTAFVNSLGGQGANWAAFKSNISANPPFTAKGTIVFRSSINVSSVQIGVDLWDSLGINPALTLVFGSVSGVVAGIEYTVVLNFPFNFAPTYDRLYFYIGATSGGGFNGTVRGDFELQESNKDFAINIIDPNFSDFFASAVNSNGRPWINDINAAQVFNPTLMRWGLAFQPDTNINQTNRFKSLNFDEIDRAKGQIQRFKVRDRTLRIFQERACASTGVYTKYVQDSGSTNVLTTTDDIITKNNVQYYQGEFGLGSQPTSLVSGKNQDYGIDPIRGYQWRLSNDGLIPISELYKGQFYIQPLFAPYNDNYLRADGSRAKILGYYDYSEEEYVTVLQGGTLGDNTIPDKCFMFNEKRNAYCTFSDLKPEEIICAGDVTYSFKNGQIYIHNNTTTYTNYYGVQYYPSIILLFNEKEAIRKKWMAIGYQSNQIFVSPINGDINTGMINSQTGLNQISQLILKDYQLEENIRTAAFLRDANSMANAQLALVNGDYLGGDWIEVNLTYLGGSFAWLYLPYVSMIISNRNF